VRGLKALAFRMSGLGCRSQGSGCGIEGLIVATGFLVQALPGQLNSLYLVSVPAVQQNIYGARLSPDIRRGT